MMPTDALWIIAYAIALLSLGSACGNLVSRIDFSPSYEPTPRVSPIETHALHLTLGLGLLPWLLLMLSMLGVRPMRWTIIGLGVASLLIIVVTARRDARTPTPRQKLAWYALPAMALLLVQAVWLGSVSRLATFDYDAIAVWGLKARILFLQPLAPMPTYFLERSLSFTHLDYPLLMSMLWAGAFSMQGHSDEVAGRAILLLATVAIAGMSFGFAQPRVGRSVALLLAAVAVGSFTTTRWAAQGLADPTLAMFILAAAVSLVRYIEARRTSDAILAGAFAAFAAWTKLEGAAVLAMTALLLGAMLIGLPHRRRSFAGLATLLAIVLPWLIWSHQLPHTHENYQARLTVGNIAQHLNRFPDVVRAAWKYFIVLIWWPIGLPLLASLLLGIGALSRPAVVAAWLLLLGLVAADLGAYLVTPWEIDLLLMLTLERLLLQLTPLLVLLTTLHWETILLPRRSAHPPSLDPP